MAIVEIGKRINVLVESEAKTSDYSATSQIKSSVSLGFLQKMDSRQLESGEWEFRGYVCNSDAAKPFLDWKEWEQELKKWRPVCD